MIEKVEVRRMLATYESKIKKEKDDICNEMEELRKACGTFDMEQILLTSVKYNVMREKVLMLTNILWDISDIRCSEALEDAED